MLFDKFKLNDNNFTHFNFNIGKDIKKEDVEKDILKCINYLIENDDFYLLQGRYLIVGKKYKDGEINIYVTSDFYNAVLFPEYKSVDWIENSEE